MAERQLSRRDIAIKNQKNKSETLRLISVVKAGLEALILVYLVLTILRSPNLIIGPNQGNDFNITSTELGNASFSATLDDQFKNLDMVHFEAKPEILLQIVCYSRAISLMIQVITIPLITSKKFAWICVIHALFYIILTTQFCSLVSELLLLPAVRKNDIASATWISVTSMDGILFIGQFSQFDPSCSHI